MDKRNSIQHPPPLPRYLPVHKYWSVGRGSAALVLNAKFFVCAAFRSPRSVSVAEGVPCVFPRLGFNHSCPSPKNVPARVRHLNTSPLLFIAQRRPHSCPSPKDVPFTAFRSNVDFADDLHTALIALRLLRHLDIYDVSMPSRCRLIYLPFSGKCLEEDKKNTF